MADNTLDFRPLISFIPAKALTNWRVRAFAGIHQLSQIVAFLFVSLYFSPLFAQSLDTARLTGDLRELSSGKYEGRKTGTRGAAKAAQYIADRFEELGIRRFGSTYYTKFEYQEENSRMRGQNIIGWIRGRTDKAIVISAHYDHLGKSPAGIYYGADDNASGVAALLSLADYFHDKLPNHTLIFAAFDAEESGLRGARAFVENPPVGLSSIVLNINMDMISRSDKEELYVAGSYRYPWIKEIIGGAGETSGVKLRFGHDLPDTGHNDWTFQSDHGAFAEKNIPFMYFGVEDHADYHKTTDRFENIKGDFFKRAANTILQALLAVDAQNIEIRSKR